LVDLDRWGTYNQMQHNGEEGEANGTV